MIVFYSYLLIFVVGAFFGWILELFYRRKKHGCWVNPGFLNGPTLPIYGLGFALMHLIASFNYGLDNKFLIIFIQMMISGLGMTLIELFAGIIFIKYMHVQLWDYSKERFNYKGIICLKFSIIWTILGLLFIILVNPFISDIARWFIENVDIVGFFLGMYYGVFIIDFFISLNITEKIKKFAKEHDIIVSYENLKYHIKGKYEELKEKKASFIMPFKTNRVSFKELLEGYLEKHKELRKKGDTDEDDK